MTAPSIRIRCYDPADLDTLIDLFTNSVRTVARRDYTEEQVLAWAPDEVDRERWATRRGSRPTWVAELSGTIVGFTDLEPHGHIDMMFVHADHQRSGIASALLRQVEMAARVQRLPRLTTEASITARPFFARHGFRVINAQTIERRGQTLINYRMEKAPL